MYIMKLSLNELRVITRHLTRLASNLDEDCNALESCCEQLEQESRSDVWDYERLCNIRSEIKQILQTQQRHNEEYLFHMRTVINAAPENTPNNYIRNLTIRLQRHTVQHLHILTRLDFILDQ